MDIRAVQRTLSNASAMQVLSNPALLAADGADSGVSHSYFTTDQAFGGETFAEGDYLIGSNASGQPNIFFDASDPSISFRIGTTVLLELTTSNLSELFTNVISFVSQENSDTLTGDVEIDHHSQTYVRITGATAAFNVYAVKNGLHTGHFLILQNDTSYVMTLKNNYGSPSSGYTKTYTLTGNDVVIQGFGCALFIYNASSAQWFMLAHNGAGAGNWVRLTGTANSGSTWDTGTITHAQLSQRVKAMEDLLYTYGILQT